jgi:hypothetical protein
MRSAISCRRSLRQSETRVADSVDEASLRIDHGVVRFGRLSIRVVLWDFVDVNRQITIRRLLAILMIAGLTLAPLSRPVMAGATPEASMTAMAEDMSASAAMDEMAGDMPCCPAKAPTPLDCDKCVFMAACMSQVLEGPAAAILRPPFAVSGKIASLQNDFWPDGLGQPPPEHPPRTLV